MALINSVHKPSFFIWIWTRFMYRIDQSHPTVFYIVFVWLGGSRSPVRIIVQIQWFVYQNWLEPSGGIYNLYKPVVMTSCQFNDLWNSLSSGELDAGAVGPGNQSANQAPEMRTNSRSSVSSDSLDLGSKQKAVNERATLFKITSNAMINASAEFLDLCQGKEN